MFDLTSIIFRLKKYPIDEADEQLERLSALSIDEKESWIAAKKWEMAKYHFTNNKIYRKGMIEVELLTGSTWLETGAQLKVNVVNLELRDLNTGLIVEVNGTRTFTNLTGDLDILDLVEGSNEMLFYKLSNIFLI